MTLYINLYDHLRGENCQAAAQSLIYIRIIKVAIWLYSVLTDNESYHLTLKVTQQQLRSANPVKTYIRFATRDNEIILVISKTVKHKTRDSFLCPV